MNDEDSWASWEHWPEQLGERASAVVEQVRTGASSEALDTIDGMIADLNTRRATVAELANALD